MGGKDLESKLLNANLHLNDMVIALDNISSDKKYHYLPDPLKAIKYFKEGFNGTSKKIVEYNKMRENLALRVKNTPVEFDYTEKRLYLYEFIKEPYSAKYPEAFYIRFLAHALAHIELHYYIKSCRKENYSVYTQLKKELGKKFIEPKL